MFIWVNQKNIKKYANFTISKLKLTNISYSFSFNKSNKILNLGFVGQILEIIQLVFF